MFFKEYRRLRFPLKQTLGLGLFGIGYGTGSRASWLELFPKYVLDRRNFRQRNLVIGHVVQQQYSKSGKANGENQGAADRV